jgi:hypothetical protein
MKPELRAYSRPSNSRSSTTSNARPRNQPVAKPSIPIPQRDPNTNETFALINIPDLPTRQNVAQLMAVAPGLEIRDLYDLLANMNGDFNAARKQAIRASRAPSLTPSVTATQPSTRLPPPQKLGLALEDHSDEVMVKIDPNSSFLEWVRTPSLNMHICRSY